MKSNGIYICPADDFDCPYYKRGFCYMAQETGDSPLDQCEAWADEEDE